MGLLALFSSSSPSCLADPAGDGFTLLGPASALTLPALELVPTPGTGGVLIRSVEVTGPSGLPADELAVLRELWRAGEGRALTGQTVVPAAGPVRLTAVPSGTGLPLAVLVQYEEKAMAAGRPGSTLRTTRATTTLRLGPAEGRPTPRTPPATASRSRAEDGSGTWYDPAQWTAPTTTEAPGAAPAAPWAATSRSSDATVHHASGPVGDTPRTPAQRVPDHVQRHRGFAAVDFGTTNSTVTIHDMRQLDVRAMSRQQEARLRRELVRLLSDPAVPGRERAQWRELLDDVARQLLPMRETEEAVTYDARAEPGRALADALVGGQGGDGWLHALYTALELRLASRDDRLRGAVAPLLHACFDHAFDELPLDVLRLFPVDLDQSGGTELASRVEVVDTQPELRVRMGEERVAVGGTADGAPRAYRGLKQYLGRDQPMPELPTRADGTPTTADDLIREGLRYLLDQSDEFITANPKEFDQGRIDHVVMTYPTIAPPGVRRRLRQLVGGNGKGVDGLGVTLVDTQFDEAVAAALFFIMRDFGGDFAAGVEAFRARCRPLPGNSRAWQQNVMVLDIGGGTSDLALINLRLRDNTPDPAPGQDVRFTGRLYALTPKLLGSTGHLQLGGDLMTLRLFRWYKAAFADHLLTRWPDRHERVVATLKSPYAMDGQYVPGSLLARDAEAEDYPDDLVDLVVPTRWEGLPSASAAEAEQTFWLLWRLAEDAKIQAGADLADHRPQPEALEAVLTRLGVPDALGTQWAPAMDGARFERLMTPVLDEIMDLVVALAQNGLQDGELDRIFLSGKSSRMPLIRRTLERRLLRESGVRWNSAGIAVEEQYGKLATSIGACWGHHVRRFAHDESNAQGVLGRGRYVLRIEVDNLRYYLPCDFAATFQLGAAATPTYALLKVGDQLSPIGPGGTWAIRSKWERQPKSLRVHRGTGTSWVEWGAFDPDDWLSRREPHFTLDLEEWSRQVRFQVEVDADLSLHLHLVRGEPQYEVHGRPHTQVNLDDGADGQWTPMEIVVDTRVAGDRPDRGTVVFSLTEDPRSGPDPEAGRTEPDASGPVWFNLLFRESVAAGARVVRGRMSEPLPPPPHDGWSFYLRYPTQPDRALELVDVVNVPDRESREPNTAARREPRDEGSAHHEGVEYVATLDEHGRLRVHRTPVPYWAADSIADMWHNVGAVFRVGMNDATAAHIAERDPFNGRH
ncbi:hypothetical protein [Streptomyces sp. S.PB5]|uniref:hypothetical protein n=1 Tax=Streptomyces sp. S.PB5 TaxID=3020844 RepID=UPI0025AF59D7|nr:hypothetical protein [Streptomyces sp. S.PB5]MDN3025882.1 hypothetical protein [Streptomyces sp. S.PB5]